MGIGFVYLFIFFCILLLIYTHCGVKCITLHCIAWFGIHMHGWVWGIKCILEGGCITLHCIAWRDIGIGIIGMEINR